MSVSSKDIQKPIEEEMALFEKKFRGFMKSKVPLLDNIMGYIVKRKGKQLRPILTLLTAGLHGDISEKTYRGAALVELLHTATLVHDDVVDDSNYRRGFFSINALWKNKVAVLVGDYLLSKGLLLSVDNEDFDLLKIMSNAVREMSEGELLQLEKSRLLNITEEVYFDIIRQKTATLIAACCAIGVQSAGGKSEDVEHFRQFGETLGIAFQIKDDLFDYGTNDVGKPVGIDIKEKKMTLPLIYALREASWLEKRRIVSLVKNHGEKPEKVQKIIAFVKEKGGLDYTREVMDTYYQKAKSFLDHYPDSEYKSALYALVDYVIQRKK